jgi:hypothetical protein
MSKFVGPEPGALVFCGPTGVPIRRSNFGRMSGWSYAVRSIGAEGLHLHDLRHTGNTFAATGGTGIKDLMARMGHDSERAALIYQHQARGADKIITPASTPTSKPSASARKITMMTARRASWCRSANGPLMTRSMFNRKSPVSNARIFHLNSQGP